MLAPGCNKEGPLYVLRNYSSFFLSYFSFLFPLPLSLFCCEELKYNIFLLLVVGPHVGHHVQ